ncbi:LysR family transcriptional regulator [Achromobacter denitrificans]|uniref:LysR family transcriptional regulator n=1 Tax=Achromobacter denitrificans TaxID=32002 RepID=UPI000F690FC4|nr:LysR family transcriptional regulator [Achromobacter denitrificans]RSE79715.1 LysR family transcriptional regulator [Achromobacter denitrificans]
MTLSIRSLQHFAVLAEEKHFSRAAQRLHLTQSALTRSIQALEASLGLVLVDRASTGVVPTQAGLTVLERAQRILGETRDLRREAELIRGHDTGRVSLGVGVFPAAGFLSPLLVRIAREHPGLSVHVEVESWQRLLDKLLQDKLDFAVAVTHSLPPPDDFAVRPLPLAYPATGQLTHSVIHRARRTLSPTAERVIELVQELLADAAAPRAPAKKPRRR